MPDPDFPVSLTITLPFPTHRLASTALRAIQVDRELSPLVQRTLSLTSPTSTRAAQTDGASRRGDGELSVLRTEYRAATNRMLRVAVNGFMESLSVVLEVMQELDVDVLGGVRIEDGGAEESGRGVEDVEEKAEGGLVNGHV